MYLSSDEFSVLAGLPGGGRKTRYGIALFGVDVFRDELEGLVLAEAEVGSALEAEALIVPSFVVAAVTGDERFTGGKLVLASPEDIGAWLLEYEVVAEGTNTLDKV